MTTQCNQGDLEREEKIMSDINQFLEGKFKDEAFAREYYRQAAFYRLADQVLLLRKHRGLTQVELAERAGTTQAVISRLENVSVRPSMDTITRIAQALDAVVRVELTPREDIRRGAAEVQPGVSWTRRSTRHFAHQNPWEMGTQKSSKESPRQDYSPHKAPYVSLAGLPLVMVNCKPAKRKELLT